MTTLNKDLTEYLTDAGHLPDELLLGEIVWYSVGGVCIDRADLVKEMLALDLDFPAPPAPTGADVFLRVCTDHEKNEITGEDIQPDVIHNYLIRKVAKDSHIIHKQLVRERVDPAGHKLDYVTLGDLLYDRQADKVFFTPQAGCTDAAYAIAAEVEAEFLKWRHAIGSYALREMIRKMLLSWNAIAVRPTGGVYFLRTDNRENLTHLSKLLLQIPGTSQLHCVSGDTLIHTRKGLYPIEGLVGKPVEIWNGEQWSEVEPFYSGRQPLYRVTFTDGSYLDATPDHRWQVRKQRSVPNVHKTVTTLELKPRMALPRFSPLDQIEGIDEPNAYVWGHVAGDGNLHTIRSKTDDNKAWYHVETTVYEREKEMLPSLTSKTYAWQVGVNGLRFCKPNVSDKIPYEQAKILRETDSLPAEIFSWNDHSLREFFGGWIDTDGEMQHQELSDNYSIYGKYNQLRLGQMLLRRIGINHASLLLFVPAGKTTHSSVGTVTTTRDHYRLRIPSYEADLIRDHVRIYRKRAEIINNRYKTYYGRGQYSGLIDKARTQRVKSIELISPDADTFCFTEPIRGMGLFNNVLTYQCLPLVDSGKQREMLRAAFEAETVGEADDLIGDIQEVLKGDKKIREATFQNLTERWRFLVEKTADYSNLLEMAMENSASRLEILQKTIIQAAERIQ